MSKLIKQRKILSLPREKPTRFILREWAFRSEYSCVQRNDKKSTVGRFDLLSYLDSLEWSSPLSIHDLKLCFEVFTLRDFGTGWDFCSANKSLSKLLNLSYPVRVQCYETGKVMVSVKCSARAFPLDNNGLLALTSLLGEVKCALHAPCVPEPSDWEIVHWHLNRDSEKLTGGGLDMHLTFKDFFGDAAQFYYKRQLEVMRAEVIQSPKASVHQVFEKIIDRNNFGQSDVSNA